MVHLNKNFIIFLLLLSLLTLSSCAKSIGNLFPGRPNKEFKFGDDVSPEFKKGWEDGCETGMAAGSNTFYKMFYRNNAMDGYMMTGSNDYKNAWGNGFWYCYRADFVKQESSIWGSMFSGYR